MTSQLISRPSKEQESASRSQTEAANNDGNLSKLMQSYKADRLVKYLHLQAEVEVLLQKVKVLGDVARQ